MLEWSASKSGVLEDIDRDPDRNQIKQFEDVRIAHAHAANRTRLSHDRGVRAAVQVDETSHRINLAQTIEPRLTARQPQEPGEHPIATRELASKFRRIDLAGGTTLHEYSVRRLPMPNLGTYDVPASGGTVATIFFADASARRGHEVTAHQPILVIQQLECLTRDQNTDVAHALSPERLRTKNSRRMLPQSSASTPDTTRVW